MQHINSTVERLDTTLERLTDISADVSKLIAVQETRLQYQESNTSSLTKVIEKLQQDSKDTERDIIRDIHDIEQKFSTKLDNVEEQLIKELQSVRDENRKAHEAVQQKIGLVERWIWVVTGGAAVVGFILSKITSLIKF
jgi:ElaB/YqjD/DUF883 family membrane-anchored ribosome-binding protein